MHLIYFTDPMCSWCWGFTPVLTRLIEETNPKPKLHIVAGGLYPGQTTPMSKERREAMPGLWQKVGEVTGQTFVAPDWPEDFCYNTEPSCLAVVTARELEPDDEYEFLTILHRAFYTEQQDITRIEVLQQLYSQFRPDHSEQFNQLLETSYIRKLTWDGFEYTRHILGAASFPTLAADFNINGLYKISPGYNDFEVVRDMLEIAKQKVQG